MTSDCYVADDELDMGRRVKAVESALIAFSYSPQGNTTQATKSGELCRLFNAKVCHFRSCK